MADRKIEVIGMPWDEKLSFLRGCRDAPGKILMALLFFVFVKTSDGADFENYTYQLIQSTREYQFWTTPPSRRVFKDDDVPVETDSIIRVYAAGNESEPFQVVVKPAVSGTVGVQVDDFGFGMSVELFQVKYVNIDEVSDNLGQTGPYPDPLWPLENSADVDLQEDENTSFWVTLTVPPGTPTGNYPADITIGAVRIPVQLHVFDFSIPERLHVRSQMNFDHNTILQKYGVTGTGSEYWMYVDMMKQFFIDHRLTPKSVLWSGGLTGAGGASYISYDCDTGIFTDPHGIWGFEQPAERYLDGSGTMSDTFGAPFNGGTGFPSFMAITFQDNDASADQRPSSFCGHTRSSSDWYSADNPNSGYNQKWFTYMADTQDYLDSRGYLDKAYYYFANEPQDQADYDAVAWYSRFLKNAAPNLRLMVSEEPKPEIFDHSDYVQDNQIDIWLPVLNNYSPEISHDRELNHGEESWIYFLHGTRPPYFNPITLDHPGIEGKFAGWFLWKYRLRGIAYYSVNNWSQNPWTDPMTDNHNGDTFMLYPPSETNNTISYGANNHRLVPSIRLELMRDSLEDYEYLYILNEGNQPIPKQLNISDLQADKVIGGLTSYTRDNEFVYNLRRLIGLKNGNEIESIPDIQPPSLHPRTLGEPGDYYINFQDPSGSPAIEPLVVNANTYIKIGWNVYDQELGYGWYGDMAHVMYEYRASGPNELQSSIMYDDWGREKVFEFDLPNGTYMVTVSVGWQGGTYSHNNIVIEGTEFINDEASNPYLVRTLPVTIADNKLTMEMGIFNEYTMLNYLDIEAISPTASFTALPLSGFMPLEVSFTDQSGNSPSSWQWDFNLDGVVDADSADPSHTFSRAGRYTVSLTAGNTYGSDTETKVDYIRVFQPGDVNCDDLLNLGDVLLLLQLQAGLQILQDGGCPNLGGDLDGDGKLGMGDVVAALQLVADE